MKLVFSKFTEIDYGIVRALLRKLPAKQRYAITLKFWNEYSIDEIAKTLRISWHEANEIIEDGLSRLKDACMLQPAFSKNKKCCFNIAA